MQSHQKHLSLAGLKKISKTNLQFSPAFSKFRYSLIKIGNKARVLGWISVKSVLLFCLLSVGRLLLFSVSGFIWFVLLFCIFFSFFHKKLWRFHLTCSLQNTYINVLLGRDYRYHIKCNYLKNQKTFCCFFITLFEFILNLQHFPKKEIGFLCLRISQIIDYVLFLKTFLKWPC